MKKSTKRKPKQYSPIGSGLISKFTDSKEYKNRSITLFRTKGNGWYFCARSEQRGETVRRAMCLSADGMFALTKMYCELQNKAVIAGKGAK